jgi:signal transduction histidine kinase
MESLKSESLARLRHDLRTPVNHILGYAELLIEDAGERHLEALIPFLQEIQNGGRQLLETIQNALGEKSSPAEDVDLDSFRQHLGGAAAEVLETCTWLLRKNDDGDPQTRTDLDAISRALGRLLEFSAEGVLPAAPANARHRS